MKFVSEEIAFSGMKPHVGYLSVAKIAGIKAGLYPCVAIAQQDSMRASLFDGEKFVETSLPKSNYEVEWVLALPSEFCVNTPEGVLRVFDKGDPDYPGVYVDLTSDAPGVPETTLAMVEWVPGGESTSDYPNDNAETRRQNAEVPPERRKSDGVVDRVTPGFVTRAWPDERHDEDKHFRTFHFGYKEKEDN